MLEGARVERHLAAILAADVAGYSRLMGTDEVGTLARLRTHRGELLDPAIEKHRDHIANTAGDSIIAEFGSVVDAVTCAVEIQRGMLERNSKIPSEQRIEFRIGINGADPFASSEFWQGKSAGANHSENQPRDTGGDDRHDAISRKFFHEQISRVGSYWLQRPH